MSLKLENLPVQFHIFPIKPTCNNKLKQKQSSQTTRTKTNKKAIPNVSRNHLSIKRASPNFKIKKRFLGPTTTSLTNIKKKKTFQLN